MNPNQTRETLVFFFCFFVLNFIFKSIFEFVCVFYDKKKHKKIRKKGSRERQNTRKLNISFNGRAIHTTNTAEYIEFYQPKCIVCDRYCYWAWDNKRRNVFFHLGERIFCLVYCRLRLFSGMKLFLTFIRINRIVFTLNKQINLVQMAMFALFVVVSLYLIQYGYEWHKQQYCMIPLEKIFRFIKEIIAIISA